MYRDTFLDHSNLSFLTMEQGIFNRVDAYDNNQGTLIGFYRDLYEISIDLRPSDLQFHELLASGNYVQLTEFYANPELFDANPLLAWAEGEIVNNFYYQEY